MLERLKFTNFKSWPDANLECGPITGLFGTNSSGKTSILQFLLLLKQTKDATDRAIALELNGPLVQLGSIKDVIHKHNEQKAIELAVAFKLDNDLILNDASGKRTASVSIGRRLELVSEIEIYQKAPLSRKIAYELGNMRFELAPRHDRTTQFQLLASAVKKTTTEFSFKRTPGRVWQLPGPIKSYAFPDQARTYFQNSGFLADLEAAYEAEIDRIFYLGPLRDYPKRDYLWARSRPSDVGQKGEKTIDAILAATEDGTKLNVKPKSRLEPFQAIISHWLKHLGLIHSFEVTEIAEGSNRWQAKVVTREGGSEVLLTDVGFGVSQVLPVITLLQYVPEGATVILEQPEIHLHPLAQAGLADVIIQAATHRKVQVILESHSEHLLLRLQRRIAEERISADDVKLYFCDAPRSISNLTSLQVDLFGNINNWPPLFMGDAFNETAKAELARLNRMKAAE